MIWAPKRRKFILMITVWNTHTLLGTLRQTIGDPEAQVSCNKHFREVDYHLIAHHCRDTKSYWFFDMSNVGIREEVKKIVGFFQELVLNRWTPTPPSVPFGKKSYTDFFSCIQRIFSNLFEIIALTLFAPAYLSASKDRKGHICPPYVFGLV